MTKQHKNGIPTRFLTCHGVASQRRRTLITAQNAIFRSRKGYSEESGLKWTDPFSFDRYYVSRYSANMIASFRCRETERIFGEHVSKKLPLQIQRTALRKLIQIHRAADLADLRAPPNNRLELLKGNRRGRHSIRINDQWRICFRWSDGNAEDVEIVDYH